MLAAVGVSLVFLVFVVRLFQLQILEGADLRERSQQNSVRTLVLEAPRGQIVDREGRVLAASRPAYRVQVIPNELSEPKRTFDALSQLLGRQPEDLAAQVGGACDERPTEVGARMISVGVWGGG